MSEFKLNSQVCDFLLLLAEKQLQIQNAQRLLNSTQMFDPYLMFREIDIENKQYISVDDLYCYLERNKLFCSQKELKGIFFEESETTSQMTYHDFLRIVGANNFKSHQRQVISVPDERNRDLIIFFDNTLEAYKTILQQREKLHEHADYNCHQVFNVLGSKSQGYADFDSFSRFFKEAHHLFSIEQYQLILCHIGLHQPKITKKRFLQIFEGKTCKKCTSLEEQDRQLQTGQKNVGQPYTSHISPVKKGFFDESLLNTSTFNSPRLKSGCVGGEGGIYQVKTPQMGNKSGHFNFNSSAALENSVLRRQQDDLQRIMNRANEVLFRNEEERYLNLNSCKISPMGFSKQQQQNASFLASSQSPHSINHQQKYFSELVLQEDGEQLKENIDRKKKHKEFNMELIKTSKNYFKKRADEFSDEYMIDYKFSPSKSRFHKRDYNYHLDPYTPYKYLLGYEERKSSMGNINRYTNQPSTCRFTSPLQSDARTAYNYQKFLETQSPCSNNINASTQITDNYASANKYNSFSSPKKVFQQQNQQWQLQNSPYSKKTGILQEQQQGNTSNSFVTSNKGKSLNSSQYVNYQSPLFKNQETSFNYCQEKRESIISNPKIVEMIQEFLVSLEKISQIEEQIEQTRCAIAKNREFNLKNLFYFYQKEGFEYITCTQFLQFFRDCKLLVKDNESNSVFKRFDLNGDNVLSYQEFEKILMPLNSIYTNLIEQRNQEAVSSSERIMAKTDYQNEDQQLIQNVLKNYDLRFGVKKLLQELLERENLYMKFRQHLISSNNFNGYCLFTIMDADENGVVTFTEFEQFLRENNFISNNSVYLQLFNLFDSNLDGLISYPEFIAQVSPQKLK